MPGTSQQATKLASFDFLNSKLYSNALQSNLKPESPPHPGDDRNTEKVKMGHDQVINENMEAKSSQEPTSQEIHVSASCNLKLFRKL